MDVYQVLMQDHRIVEELFSEIEKSDDREVERREQLFLYHTMILELFPKSCNLAHSSPKGLGSAIQCPLTKTAPASA